MRVVATAMAMTLAAEASAQSFSCRIGTRPACLEFGDTICSSRGKCVNSDAVCFDSYQCNFEGFTCRSNVTACVEDYNELLRRHNALVDDFNDLLEQANRVRSEAEAAKRCVQWATNLQEAQFCF